MRYLIRVNELEKKIDFLKQQLDIIDENIINLEKAKLNIHWQGSAGNAFLNKYDNHILKLKNIQRATVLCIGYFMKYYNGYSDQYTLLRNKYSKLFDMEDKNGYSSF